MHFGRLDNVRGIRFAFPPDSARTTKFLALPREGKTSFYVGCPIWASKNWNGEVYPKGSKIADYLKVYAQQFKTVEVNSTFYHPLGADRLKAWKEETPPGFRFCPKVFRGITEQLDGPNLAALVEGFCQAVAAFDDRLGLSFAQFSDYFSPQQIGLLENFLKVWPREIPLAVELRHPGWFRDHALLDPVVNLLYRHRVSTVITDTPGRQDVLHTSLTQPKMLVRFQGHSGDETDSLRLAHWAERLKFWASHSMEEIYFFAHQPEDALIPRTARTAVEMITGEPVVPLVAVTTDVQMELSGF